MRKKMNHGLPLAEYAHIVLYICLDAVTNVTLTDQNAQANQLRKQDVGGGTTKYIV